jgi:hypothetical protein
MAINYQGLQGKIEGQIGKSVFYVVNGQNVVRRLPRYDYNKRSPLQQKNRKNIALLVKFFQQLKPVLYLTLNNRPENRAVYHHFLALNLSVSVSLVFSILSFSFYQEPDWITHLFKFQGMNWKGISSRSPGSHLAMAINQAMTSCRQSFFQKQNQFLILP